MTNTTTATTTPRASIPQMLRLAIRKHSTPKRDRGTSYTHGEYVEFGDESPTVRVTVADRRATFWTWTEDEGDGIWRETESYDARNATIADIDDWLIENTASDATRANNPPVSPSAVAAVLRVALKRDVFGDGVFESDLMPQGMKRGELGRTLSQMKNAGLVREWKRSQWYGPGWTLTDKGREVANDLPQQITVTVVTLDDDIDADAAQHGGERVSAPPVDETPGTTTATPPPLYRYCRKQSPYMRRLKALHPQTIRVEMETARVMSVDAAYFIASIPACTLLDDAQKSRLAALFAQVSWPSAPQTFDAPDRLSDDPTVTAPPVGPGPVPF